MQSPLRYPGSKADLLPVITEIFRNTDLVGLPLVEPYAGSASVSIGLVDAGISPSAQIGERDPLLYSFWKSVFERTDELIERFLALPITLETWYRLRPLLNVSDPTTSKDFVKLGLAGLFFNRTNFSGILDSGPIGGFGQNSKYKINCRTNKDDILCRILSIASLGDRIEVHFGDAIELIQRQKRKSRQVLYVDPPYFVQGDRLYRYNYGLSEHKRLAKALEVSKNKWLLSYDDHHVIKFLYDDFNIREHSFRYSARCPKFKNELLISNFKLPRQLNGWKVV